LALAHGQELLAHAFHWPELIGRVLIGTLVVGFPIAVALAWYHGHRGLTRISAGEMTVVSVLLLMSAGLLIVLVRVPQQELGVKSPVEPGETHTPQNQTSAATSSSSVTGRAPSSEQTSIPRASIGVLPFANLTGDATKEYFSDGMAEELINSLAQVPGLKVPARTSSFAYKGRDIDIRRIAQELGVATILEGSVRAAGAEIRVTAQLVDAKSGFHVWSQSYDRQFADIFKLQDDVSAAIVQALRSQMNIPLAAPVASAPPTQNLEAYQLYQQANSVMTRMTEEGFRSAFNLYQQALARDPNFARALAAKASLRLFFIRWGYPMPDALQSAESEARRALDLDPHLSEAQGVLGTAYATRGRWLDAERAFRTAFALNPEDAETLSAHAIVVLAPVGHMRKAVEETTAAYHSAPANQIVVMRLAASLGTLGSDADALRYADLGVELGYNPNAQPGSGVRVAAASRAGRYTEAADLTVASLRSADRLAGGEGVIRQVFAAVADPAKKAEAIASLRSLAAQSPTWLGNDLYQMYVGLGALDDAYANANALLDRLARTGEASPNNWRELWNPEMRPFRLDPRFQAFVTRLKLFDYWKQYGPPDECDLVNERLVCR
jgi:TolB-like protein